MTQAIKPKAEKIKFEPAIKNGLPVTVRKPVQAASSSRAVT